MTFGNFFQVVAVLSLLHTLTQVDQIKTNTFHNQQYQFSKSSLCRYNSKFIICYNGVALLYCSFTVRQRSWGKVMFSVMSVRHSVYIGVPM